MIANSSRRLTRVKCTTLRVANFQMALSLDPRKNKCFCIPIMPKVVVGATTHADVKELGLEHQCECGEPFLTDWGLQIHQRTCAEANDEMELTQEGGEVWEVAELMDVRGPPSNRFWRVRWTSKNADGTEHHPDETGDGTERYGWQKERYVDGCEDLQNVFWRCHAAQEGYSRRGDNEQEGEFRCARCNRIYRNLGALQRHKSGSKNRGGRGWRMKPCKQKVRRYAGTKIDERVMREKRVALLKDMRRVEMSGVPLPYKMSAGYLGSILQSDGGCEDDLAARMRAARRRFNELKWMFADRELGTEMKLGVFRVFVLSIFVYGGEGWHLDEKTKRQINGWSSRCLSVITGKTVHDEASTETKSMDVVAILRYRRRVWLGHIFRDKPGDRLRRDLLRNIELDRRGELDVAGCFWADAPESDSNDDLVQMAGGAGSMEERRDVKRRWKRECIDLLAKPDQLRMFPSHRCELERANTREETISKLAAVEHRFRIYTDGGCDDSGEGGIAGWGASAVRVTSPDAQPETDETPVADLWGRVVLDKQSVWFQGCARATNNTGELTGIAQALLWLLHIDESTDPAVIVYDSMYAANMAQGKWQPKKNVEVIAQVVQLLAEVRARRVVHFVHSKGHSEFWGNDRADLLADWGKCDGPYSRIRAGGASEGDGVRHRVDENEEASRQLAAKAEADDGRRVAGVTGGVVGAEPAEEDADDDAAADDGAAVTAAVLEGGARVGALGRIDEEDIEDGDHSGGAGMRDVEVGAGVGALSPSHSPLSNLLSPKRAVQQ
jgi:ribonuclease HI